MDAVHTVVPELKTIFARDSCVPGPTFVPLLGKHEGNSGCRGRNACSELDSFASSPLLTVLSRFSVFWFQNSPSPEELSAR